MKLVSFSVENYRSITTARKIPIANYCLLIGANNEGKSNILHAVALAMDTLINSNSRYLRTSDGRIIRRLISQFNRRSTHLRYDWQTDFPISKQNSKGNKKTIINLEFELDDSEVEEFKNEIRSSLNGTLPIAISFGDAQDYEISVQKPGKGHVALNKKSPMIADFVSRRMRFEYIPAIRTAQSASEVIAHLVEKELRTLEKDSVYTNAIDQIEKMQQPILEKLGQTIQSTIAKFLPNVKNVSLEPRRDARFRAMGREVDILVNDGENTKLERKGDGVQSLTALALMKYASEESSSASNTIIAIEEPESHLHPNAVHELREVIEDLSKKTQIVLTSHSPLFVNAMRLKNTIVVKESKAKCATHIAEIREALGVRFADNLQNASLVLLCEGPDDQRVLNSILSSRSQKLNLALNKGYLAIDSLSGASSLSQKVLYYKASACNIHCLLDNDTEGKRAAQRALDNGIIKHSDINMTSVTGLNESELEDLFDIEKYRDDFLREFGVDVKIRALGGENQKWSNRTEKQFRQSGKIWSDSIKIEIKNWLSSTASRKGGEILKKERSQSIDALIQSLESKLGSEP